MDKQQVINFMYSTDEFFGTVVMFVVLLLLTRNLPLILIVCSITYAMLWMFTKPKVVETQPTPVSKPTQPVITTKAVAKPTRVNKFGDVMLNSAFKLNITSDSVFISALKGFGKSVTIYKILMEIHSKYKPENLQVVLMDMKQTSLPIFSDSPFVYGNVHTSTEGIDVIEKLLADRQNEFGKIKGKVVDSLSKYHSTKDKTQPRFPHVILIIDEIQLLDDSDSTKKPNMLRVDSINKISRSYGITVMAATQRGATYIPKGMLSQFDTRLVGYMVNSREYKWAGLDDAVIEKMSKTKGLFAISDGSNWKVTRVDHVITDDIEKLAASWHKPKHELPSDTLNRNMTIITWFNTLQRKPTIELVMNRYGITKSPAKKLLQLWIRR